jgi:bacterioferritin-associated ferredoxin
MIVCSCNVLTDCAVRACLAPGRENPRTAAQVYRSLGCGPKCGQCATTIRTIVKQVSSPMGTDTQALRVAA